MKDNSYGSVIGAILAQSRLSPLGPGQPNESMRSALSKIELESAFAPAHIVDRDMANACLSGLWLYQDFLEESHQISQEIDTPTGSFWHAIMHRREPDAWNSKYWWRRVGPHPVLAQLREQASSLGYAYTSPEAFVDFCERSRESGANDEDIARKVQGLEWELLFNWCFRHATNRLARRASEG